MVRLIALDLDDTLLRSDLTISFYTRRILKKALDRGIAVTLASGRTLRAVLPFARKLGMDKRPAALICENGAFVQDSVTREVYDESFLPAKAAMTVYRLADADGFSVQKYDGDVTYVSRANEFTGIDARLTRLRQVVPPDFAAVVAAGCRKLLIPGDPLTLKPLEEILGTIVGPAEVTMFTSKPYFLEILPPGVNKGAALEKVAARLGISREETMAFGDSMNDEAMLRFAGQSVAMLNADPRVKAVARAVTEKTNNGDGAAQFIAHYVFEKEPFPGVS